MGTPDPGTSELLIRRTLQKIIEKFLRKEERGKVLLYALMQENRGLRMAGLQPFRPGRYGLAVRKGDKEWLDFVNATFTKMKETGEYEKLLDKWFGPVARVLWMLLELEK
jgi:hypothetical protein